MTENDKNQGHAGTLAVPSRSWWNYLGNWIIIQNSYLFQKGQAQKILSIEMSMVYLALKMVEFGLTWQQFHTTIFCHLTAIVTNRMTDLLSFSTGDKKKLAKAHFSWNKILSFLASKPTCASFPVLLLLLCCSHSSLRWIVFCWSCLISKYCWSNW